ncbi:hypothetical protein Tco_0085746 [Tanacetum coccineum]
MADSSNQEQIPLQREQIPQLHDQPDEPRTPLTYDPAPQVEFEPKQIHFKDNNEVSFIYPDYPTKEQFKIISEFISKCCLREAFIRTPTQYKEYVIEFWYTARVVEDSTRVWFSTPTGAIPSIETVREWFPTIGYNGIIEAKETLKKAFLPPSWRSPTSYSKRKKKSSSAKDFNPSQPPASTLVVAGIHKEALQATGGLTSLGVTSEDRSNPQLISVVSASTTKPVFSDSTILHFESASGHEASLAFTSEADNVISAPNDSVSKQQGLETILTEHEAKNDASKAKREVRFRDDKFNTTPNLSSSNDAKKEIKLEDLSKLIPNVVVDFMDMDSPKDDKPIIVQDKDEEEVHAEKTVKIQEMSTQVHLFQTLNYKLVKEKELAETEAALLKAKPSFPNVEQLTKLLVKSLTPELSKLLSSHDFSNSLPTELKELPSKFKDLFGEIKELKKYVHELEIKLLGDLKEIPTKLEQFNSTVSGLTIQGSKLLLKKVIEALDRFAKAIDIASHKAGDQSVLSAGQADTHPDKGKEAITHKESEEGEEFKTDSETVVRLSGSMVESYKKKKLKKFDFVSKEGDHVHLTEEQIKEQKRIKESVKADMAKREEEVGKQKLVDLLGIDVVTSVYKAKIKYDK